MVRPQRLGGSAVKVVVEGSVLPEGRSAGTEEMPAQALTQPGGVEAPGCGATVLCRCQVDLYR